MANESSSKFIKLVCTGLLDLHLTLTLTDQEAESFKVFPSKLEKMSDCGSFLFPQGANLFMTTSQMEPKKLNIYDHIRLSSKNPTINSLLVLNRAFKKKIFVEYVTMNEIRFLPEDFFMKDVLKYVTEQNFLFLVENRFLKNSHSYIKFEIKINNKSVKLFENICDNSNFEDSIHVDEIKSDSNNNINNFNTNLNNFNNSNTNYEKNNLNRSNEDKHYNENNDIEPNIDLNNDYQADGNSNHDNNLIHKSKVKKMEGDLKQNSNENITDLSANKKEENLFPNKSNTQNISKTVSNRYDNNQIIEKESSRLLVETDLLQRNNNSKTVSNRRESKPQRTLGSNNNNNDNNLLNNIDNTPERLNSKSNANDDLNNNENLNLDLEANMNKDILIGGGGNDDDAIFNPEDSAEVNDHLAEELGHGNNEDLDNLSQKPDADLTANRLLNSIENKIIDESNNNINNNNNNISNNNLNLSKNKLTTKNNGENQNQNYLGEYNSQALNNQSNHNFNENQNENIFPNPEINYSPLGIHQKSSFGVPINDLSNTPNISPNTNLTNTLIRTQKTLFERFRYDFSGCDYFFVDLNEIISLQNLNFPLKDFLDLLKKIAVDFREISIITLFPNIIKNIALLDLESLTEISDIVGLTDIYVFEKKEALGLFNLLAQLNSESDSVEEKKNLEFLFIREIKRKKRPYPKLGIFLEGLKKCTIIQQQQNSNLVVFYSDYQFDLIPPNVSSVVFEDYQKIFLNHAEHLTSVFLGGFLSRFFYKKSFNTCFTAGNESLKRIIELIRFGVEPPLDFNYYLIRIKKKEKGPSEGQKINKKKEENFVLDSTNVVNSKMREYNPLYDSNLVSFFSSKLTRTHLQKTGFINRNGVIVDDPEHKKITMIENVESKNFEKIYEQEKNNLFKIKEQKEKMRLQIKSLMNINSQTVRGGNMKGLDKLAKLYTSNPALSKKLPNIDLKKSAMKTTKFNNNLFLKEISKGNKPKSLFNFHPSEGKNAKANSSSNNFTNWKHANKDMDFIPREKSKERIGYGNVNSNNRITSYNNTKKNSTVKSKEREKSANYFCNSTNNNKKQDRVNSVNNTINNKISSASCDGDNSKVLGTAENNIRIESNYSKRNNNSEKHLTEDAADIKEENNIVKVNEDKLNEDDEAVRMENINEKENQNVNNENTLDKENNDIEREDNNAEKALASLENAEKLNSSKLSASNKLNNSHQKIVTESNQVNKTQIINGAEEAEEKNNTEQQEDEDKNKVEEPISIPKGENNSQINSSSNENKTSNADLNVSKRSRKYELVNNNETENSKKLETKENLLHPEINENNQVSKEEGKENSRIKTDTKRSDEKDREIDLMDAVMVAELHPNEIN